MAFNARPMGATQEFEVADSVVSGNIVKVGSLVGVALLGAGERENGKFYTTVALEGVVSVPLTGTPKAGDAVGVPAGGSGKVTPAIAKGGEALLGYVLNPAKSAAGTYEVKIANGVIPTA